MSERHDRTGDLEPLQKAAPAPVVDFSQIGRALLMRIRQSGFSSPTAAAASIRHTEPAGDNRPLPTLRDLREEVFFKAEYLYLHNLIDLTGRDIGKACELSGLSRSRLYTLLKKYRIHPHQAGC